MNLKSLAQTFKRELAFYRRLASHPKTPKSAKTLLGLAIGYALLPFDLIPDFLPVIGHLDDAIIVPGLIYLALKRVPQNLINECRAAADEPPIATDSSDKPADSSGKPIEPQNSATEP